ncbi:rhodanese-like domain-containing protein [Caldithrix abyssi]
MKISPKLFGFSMLFILGLILAFAPVDKMASHTVDASQLLNDLQHRNYYITPDDLAHMIINKEPGFLVVDIRSKEDFGKYHIPGSIHIPVKELLSSEDLKDLAEGNTLILASNGNTLASQAWLILKENGFDDVFILQGGLNYWVQVFTNPARPSGFYTDDELFRYQFRKAAAPVMMGTKLVNNETQKSETKISKPVFRRKNKKKAKFDEGC